MRRTIVETPWRNLAPFRVPEDEEMFAIGDVHGQAEPLALILADTAAIPRQLFRRSIVFLGDVIDRGPESARSMELVLEAERLAAVDECTFLPGNHGLMLLDALSDVDDFHLWFQNGGGTVLEEIDPEARIDIKDRGRALEKIRSALPWAFLKLVERAPSHLSR